MFNTSREPYTNELTRLLLIDELVMAVFSCRKCTGVVVKIVSPNNVPQDNIH